MHRSSLRKKLLPAKRAWKIITSNLEAKLNTLKNSGFIRTTTRRLLSSRFIRFFIPFKRRSLAKSYHPGPLQTQYYHQYQKNFAPVYVDRLFEDDTTVLSTRNVMKRPAACVTEKGQTSKGYKDQPVVGAGDKDEAMEKRSGGSGVRDVDEVWKSIVASSPQLRCVDERADEFISRFKEDMKLQRERSMLEFQEMLKRSS